MNHMTSRLDTTEGKISELIHGAKEISCRVGSGSIQLYSTTWDAEIRKTEGL
jgi:hypothetical protein